ncbi:MAG: hypothetical protein Q8O95_00055 [bacterium]|nr:hypothetical protein [bacterium]
MLSLPNTLFLLQYCFLNGFLIHWFFLKTQQSTALEIFLSSLLLSLCLNSTILYLLIRTLSFGITTKNVVMMSVSISTLLVTVSLVKRARKSV